MNKILNKRESLESFLKEQTLGPGINGYKLIQLNEDTSKSLNYLIEPPLNNKNEILEIVPAAIYSTGILFPEDLSKNVDYDNSPIITETEEKRIDEDESETDDDVALNQDDLYSIEEESIDINQMYPNTMGLTFCLDESFLKSKRLEFDVCFRYYKKKKKKSNTTFGDSIGLLCEIDKNEFLDFIAKHNINDFSIKTIGLNNFVILSSVTTKRVNELTKTLSQILKEYAIRFTKEAHTLNLNRSINATHNNISSLKAYLYNEIKHNIADIELKDNIYHLTQKIEKVENIISHLRDLLYANTTSYGLWQAESIKRTIVVNNIDFNGNKLTFLYNKESNNKEIVVYEDNKVISNSLKGIFSYNLQSEEDGYSELSANIQLTRDSREKNNKIFVKVQLVNTSTPYTGRANDNKYYSTFNESVNKKSFFGVKLKIENPLLVPYSNRAYSLNDKNQFDEDNTTRFIYRQYEDYAIGHGCSVKWSKTNNSVETEYIPTCETPDVEPIPRNKKELLITKSNGTCEYPLSIKDPKHQQFKWLSIFSKATDEEVIQSLLIFINSYGEWIESKRNENYEEKIFFDIAKQELDKCSSDYNRMKKNVELFLQGESNKQNIRSFRLMNAAMFMQLWHSIKTKNNDLEDILSESFTSFNSTFYQNADDKLFSKTEPAGWRAFQLAFILLNLDGIFRLEADTKWEARNELVDLVWFPTGGGKTEAYLGLIALTIINRRTLYKEKGGGVSAIMRYTLRLLTMQQFQRATLLIMALELIRRWEIYDLGDEPITIGLWVGDNSLPNKTEDLIEEFNNFNNRRPSKVPFTKCPWCGSEIQGATKVNDNCSTSEGHWMKDRLNLVCINKSCCFSYPLRVRERVKDKTKRPLPVCLSDEIIYQHPPTLLFGTVDKFAQLAHKLPNKLDNSSISIDSRRLFGKGVWEKGKPKDGYLPPDLIIQDELHLLLGPLGSAVALFEAAVDQLCTRSDGTRPKVISSTATTRNTDAQIAALFNRNVNIFPKPGTECDDSFFSFYKREFNNLSGSESKFLAKRKYLGILPTGKTQIWMQMRIAAILLTHRAIFELQNIEKNSGSHITPTDKSYSKAMDYYHSIVSYFNSLKEVGKTQSQVQSYILKEVRRVFNRVIRPRHLMHAIYTYGPIKEAELTGRLSGEEVKNQLSNIETEWVAENRYSHYTPQIDNEKREIIKGSIPPEFIVATNMISVGIDVSRFNTMIINSMPRNTAEYIQASSRVARDQAGLVITIYHPFRARDVSYYEKFIEFHEKMYSYVEPISITPFTKKSVNRYLGLYLSTLIRHRSNLFTSRNSAKDILSLNKQEISTLIKMLTKHFIERERKLSKCDNDKIKSLNQKELTYIKEWIEKAINEWIKSAIKAKRSGKEFVFNNKSTRSRTMQEQLYIDIEEYEDNINTKGSKKWQIPMSLRVVDKEAAITIKSI